MPLYKNKKVMLMMETSVEELPYLVVWEKFFTFVLNERLKKFCAYCIMQIITEAQAGLDLVIPL